MEVSQALDIIKQVASVHMDTPKGNQTVALAIDVIEQALASIPKK